MNIAIIDDEYHVRNEVENGIVKYIAKHYPSQLASTEFCHFSSAEDFLAGFQVHAFALIFLDIYMEELSGMDAAKKVRYEGDETPIVFLTTSTDHQLDGYAVFAAGYIMKPLTANQDVFLHVLEHCLPLALARQPQLDIVVNHLPLHVPIQNIFYLDCHNTRTVRLHLVDKVLNTSCSYQECSERLLKDQRFSECYHRVIINMDAIAQLNEEAFLLKNGDEIPISRRKKMEVKQHYMNYLLMKAVI